MNLILHPQTADQAKAFLGQPTHALLIEGPAGSGKGSLALYLAAQILEIDQHKLGSQSFFLHLEPLKGTISIETVRSIQDFLKLKTIGSGSLRRVVVVENAHAMTLEAQNAFLKMLEEPPADTVIILTATADQQLLPTIYSRVQRISVKNPSKTTLLTSFGGHPQSEVEKAFYISGGQIGLMHALLEDDEDHPLAASITEAKQIFTMNTYERLASIDRWAKNKELLPELLQALMRVCHAVLMQATEKGQTSQIKKSHHILKHIAAAQASLKHNPNTKLLLTDLMLNI